MFWSTMNPDVKVRFLAKKKLHTMYFGWYEYISYTHYANLNKVAWLTDKMVGLMECLLL